MPVHVRHDLIMVKAGDCSSPAGWYDPFGASCAAIATPRPVPETAIHQLDRVPLIPGPPDQARSDRPIHHPDVANEEDRDRIVDVARLRDRSKPQIQRIVRDRGEQHVPPKITGLRPIWSDSQPKKIKLGVANEQCSSHDVGRGQRVHLGNLLQKVQRPELTAVPTTPCPRSARRTRSVCI